MIRKAADVGMLLRILAGIVVVLFVAYACLLAVLAMGVSASDVGSLRKLTVMMLIFSLIGWTALLFLGSALSSTGSEEPPEP